MKFWKMGHAGSSKSLLEWQDTVELEQLDCPVNSSHMRPGNRIGELCVLLPTTNIKDFSWTWYGECLVHDRIIDTLHQLNLSGYTLRQVHSKFKIKENALDPCSENPGVPIQNAAQNKLPRLWEITITGTAGDPLKESGIEKVASCKTCGLKKYTPFSNPMKLINVNTWDGSDFFYVNPLRKIFVSQRVVAAFRDKQFSGVTFTPVEDLKPIP